MTDERYLADNSKVLGLCDPDTSDGSFEGVLIGCPKWNWGGAKGMTRRGWGDFGKSS